MASTINASTSPAAIVQTADGTGILALQTAGTTAVTVTAAQNVGIGTTSPTSKLTLNNGASGTDIRLQNTASGVGSGNGLDIGLGSAGDNGYIYLYENGYLYFATNATERMRIFSSGGVSIGNTTDPGATNLSVTGSNYVGVARYAPPQVTASVSTSATDILVVVASVNICWVLGTSGANYFLDLISARAGGEAVVLQSYTLLGSPAARTYALPVANAKLTMASGTYRVTVTPLGLPVS